MSSEAIVWAWRQTTGGPASKLVLTMLANVTDDIGYAEPDLEYLARVCELTDEELDTALDALVRVGLLLKDGDEEESLRYCILMPDLLERRSREASGGYNP